MTTRSKLPLGYGTAGFNTADEARISVKKAVKVGYRHFDTAQQYRHTGAVGAGINDSEIPNENLIIASKIHSEDLHYEGVLSKTNNILDNMGIEFIDLLYVHWPAHEYDPEDTFRAMQQLRKEGKIGSIGVCNFTVDLLQEAIESSPLPIFANQIELHPFLKQNELIEFCADNGVNVVAHTPFAGGEIFSSKVLEYIADSHDATIPQIVLAWLIDKDPVTAVPKATGRHIRENYGCKNISLQQKEIDEIESIEKRKRIVDYDFAPWNKEA